MKNKARLILAVATLLTSAAVPAFAKSTLVEYDAIGGKGNGGDSFKTGGKILLDRILTTKGGMVSSVTLRLKLAKADLGSFLVIGTRVDGVTGLPRNAVTLATIQDSTLMPGKVVEMTIVPAAPVFLGPKTPYYVGIARTAGGKSSVSLENTLTPAVLSRPSVQAGADYYNSGGVQANSGGPYQIKVVVTKR